VGTPPSWAWTVARLARILPGAAALAAFLLSATAWADDPWEFWPEVDLYKQHNSLIRYYFVGTYAKGKESAFRTLEAAGFVDVTFGPHLPHSRQKADWQTKKYFWLRIGYDHVFQAEGETKAAPEYRGIVALSARHYLPGGIFFEARARADLRWIEGDYSTRYRLRIEVNRDFNVLDRVVTPYFQAECFYDTRYDGWARQLYQVGAEIGVTRHFRVEPSVARQVDGLPSPSGLWAAALVARWYY
jgi:hypothetical protein